MTGNIHISNNKKTLATDFASWLTSFINSHQHNKVHIALSGGSTPIEVYDTLVNAGNNYLSTVNWDRVYFYWGDERCVPPEDNDSNFGQAKAHFFNHAPIKEKQVFRILGEREPEYEAKRYGELLTKNIPLKNQLPQFDLIILGVGDDGHTASIFPDQMKLLSSELVCEVATHPLSGQKRISLTGKVLNNASNVAFLLAGDNKKEIIKEIYEKTEKSKSYPTAHITKATTIDWFLDKEAAYYLP